MKKTLHFMFLSLAAAASMQVSAADLKKPDLQEILKFQAFVPEDTVFIYNVGQKMFFGTGEGWDHQGVVNATGLTAFFKEDEKKPGTYHFHLEGFPDDNWVWRTTSDSQAGPGVKAVYPDHGWDDSNGLWLVNDLGDNKYTISVPEDDINYVEGEVLGVDLNHESVWAAEHDGITYGTYFDIVYAESPDNATWQFVPASIIKAHNLKDDLEDKIKEAEGYGVNTDAAAAIYNSASATLEDVQGAIDKLNNDIADNVTPEHPMDMTHVIENPTFNGTAGWSATDDEGLQGDGFFNDGELIQDGLGIFTSHGIVSKVYQKQNVRPGVYKFGLNVSLASLHQNSADNPDQFVYAETSNGIAQKAPITAITAHYDVFAFVGEDGELEFGFDEINPVSNHFVIDNATLTFYGNSQEAYIYASKELGQKGDLFEEEDEDDQANYTSSYKETLNEKVAAAEATTDKAAAVAAFVETVKAYNDLEYSVGLYTRAKEEYKAVDKYVYDDGMDMENFLGELEDIIADATMSNDDLDAKLDEIRAAEVKFFKENIKEGVEYPFLTNNTFAFASTDGWNPTGAIAGANKGGATGVLETWNTDGGWDLNQTITGAKPGVWKFEVHAYFRPESNANTLSYWTATEGKNNTPQSMTHSKFSLNGKEAPISAWISKGIPDAEYQEYNVEGGLFDELKKKGNRSAEWGWWEADVTDFESGEVTHRWFPERLGNAAAIFEVPGHEKDYVASLNWIVGDDGIVDLHIFNDDYNKEQGAEWTVLREAHLYYVGLEINAMKQALKEQIDEANSKLQNTMYNGERSKLEEVLAQATTLYNTDPKSDAKLGDKIMEVYPKLVEACNVQSIEAYEQLAKELNSLKLVKDQYKATSTDEAVAVADALINKVTDGIANETFTKEDALALIPEMKSAAFELKRPKGTASDDTPQNWTFMIVNPEFKEGNEGWIIGTGGKTETEADYNTGVGEIYNSDGEISQTVVGLPVGTYKVSVQGFYRQGDGQGQMNTLLVELANKYGFVDELEEGDYEGVTEKENNAVLFGNESGVAPGYMCFDPAGNEDAAAVFQTAPGTGWLEFENWPGESVEELSQDTYGRFWRFPISLNNAACRFTQGLYNNEFYVNVVDDSDDNPADGLGTLKLGARIFNHHDYDWLPFSNWQLEYYGADSKHASKANDYNEKASIEGVTANAEIISVEFFSVDGKKLAAPQQGLNILKVKTADGKVIVRKIVKK